MLKIPEKKTPDIKPDQVLLGLILGISLGPFNNLPKIYPDISTVHTTIKIQ